MPELPEVETLKRALVPLIKNKTLRAIRFFRKDLRFPIPQTALRKELLGRPITNITRKGKYILLHAASGKMIWHLGMSGRVIHHPTMEPREKHTHAAFQFDAATCLHFIDPRRFGAILWAPRDEGHPLINHLGPDPFDTEMTALAMKNKSKNRKAPIKSFLMNAKHLAGIGNIYACESLFAAGIRPTRASGKLSLPDWERLILNIRSILRQSISAGGTTLRDFYSSDGSSGYYAIHLLVYGRENQPCPNCQQPIRRKVHSSRSTFYCGHCQKR